MARPKEEPIDEPLLFDLPLAEPTAPPRRSDRARREPSAAPQGGAEVPRAPEPSLALDAPGPALPPEEGAADPRAGLGSRLAAGAADLLVHAAAAVAVLVGCRLMGVRPALADWPALALFLLSFSFLYTVVPLAFWSHTPGMAWAGLDAHGRDGDPLAFDQTARRWIGGLLTVLLLGLPLLLSLGGRSLSDLLSGSETLSSR